MKVDTSVRKGQITFIAAPTNLAHRAQYALRVVITEHGRKVNEFTSATFAAGDLKDGRVAVTEKWRPEKLWDIHTPQNAYEAAVSLLDAGGNVLDAAYPHAFRVPRVLD